VRQKEIRISTGLEAQTTIKRAQKSSAGAVAKSSQATARGKHGTHGRKKTRLIEQGGRDDKGLQISST